MTEYRKRARDIDTFPACAWSTLCSSVDGARSKVLNLQYAVDRKVQIHDEIRVFHGRMIIRIDGTELLIQPHRRFEVYPQLCRAAGREIYPSRTDRRCYRSGRFLSMPVPRSNTVANLLMAREKPFLLTVIG